MLSAVKADASALVGREDELAELAAFIEDPESRATLVRGAPGSGRTALIEAVRDRFSHTVDFVWTSAATSKNANPYSSSMSAAQRMCGGAETDAAVGTVEKILLRHRDSVVNGEGGGSGELIAEVFAAALAAPQQRPTVIVADDIEDHDQETQDLLGAVAAHAGPHPCKVVIVESHARRTTGLAGLREITLGGLDVPSVRTLLERIGGCRVPWPVAERLTEATGGIPLPVRSFAASLSQEQLTGLEPLPVPLPLSDGVIDSVRPSLEQLPGIALAAIAMFAYLPSLGVDALAKALGGRALIDQLTASDVVRERGSRLVLTTPLHASVAWSLSTGEDRASMVEALAVGRGEERLLFSILDPSRPTESWLRLLIPRLRRKHAGRSADRIGVLAVVVEQRACDVADPGLWTALALAYEGMGALCAYQRAHERAHELPLGDADRLELHRCRIRVGDLRGMDGTEHVVAADGWRGPQLFDAHTAIAAILGFRGDIEAARSEIEVARRHDGDVDDQSQRRLSLVELAVRGRTCGVDAKEYRDEIVSQVSGGLWESPTYLVSLARELLALGFQSDARRLLTRRERANCTRAEHVTYLAALAELEVWCGRHARGLVLLQEIDRVLPSACAGLNLHSTIVRCHAATGKGEDLVERYLPPGGRPGLGRAQTCMLAAAEGYRHMAAGRYLLAADSLSPIITHGDRVPHLIVNALGDLVEALVAAGRTDEAREWLVRWREGAAQPDDRRSRYILRWCAALTASAGEVDDAFQRLLDQSDDVGDVGRARTFLAYARVLGRHGRYEDAAAACDAAAQICRLWSLDGWLVEVERVRTAQRPTGVGPGPVGGLGLAIEERRVVDMVVGGRRNKEIAAELFVSLRTVEAMLTAIYRKVSVANRGELIAAVHSHDSGESRATVNRLRAENLPVTPAGVEGSEYG